jgi:hypothetical protein
MLKRWRAWRRSGVRGFGPGMHTTGLEWYVRITPNLGAAIPWLGGRRLRIAWHHGVQIVRWYGGLDGTGTPFGRWFVEKQVLGRSRVRGERYRDGTVRSS